MFALAGRDNFKTDAHAGVEEGPEAAGFFNKNGVGINYTFVALIFPRPGWKGVLNTLCGRLMTPPSRPGLVGERLDQSRWLLNVAEDGRHEINKERRTHTTLFCDMKDFLWGDVCSRRSIGYVE